MKGKQFIKKRMAEASKRLGTYALSTTGTVVAALATNNDTVKDKVKTKWHGAILFGLGAASNLLNPEDYSNALLTGMGNYGGLLLTAQVTKKPETYGIAKEAVGLSGVGTTTAKEVDATPDWAKLAAEAKAAIDNMDEPTNGLPDNVAASLYGDDYAKMQAAFEAELAKL
jgi:hypothetical protein